LLQQQNDSINKTFGCYGNFLVAATKILFVVPNFVAVSKPFFSVWRRKCNKEESEKKLQCVIIFIYYFDIA